MSEKHSHTHDSALSRRWIWTTVGGNGAVGGAEAATAGTDTLSVATDMFHNLGMDVGTYALQGLNILHPTLSEKTKKRFRKLTHWAIMGMSLGASAKVGTDLFLGNEHQQNPGTMYAAMGSVALNGVLALRWRKGVKQKKAKGLEITADEKDIGKHLWGVDIPAATIALGGAALQRYGLEPVEQGVALAANLWGAYLFRPTKKNLAHDCGHHAHNESHRHEHEMQQYETAAKEAEQLPAFSIKNDAIWAAHEAFGSLRSYSFASNSEKCDKFANKPLDPYYTSINKESV